MTLRDEVESLYELGVRSQQRVAETAAAYAAATEERARVFKALRDAGQSFYRIGQRLGVSTARVGQIVAAGDRRRRADDAREDQS